DNLRLSANELQPGDNLEVLVSVSNTGAVDGEEVVQLYVQDKVASVTRPLKELKGFTKVMLKAGEKKDISFSISMDNLKFYDINMNYVTEPGDFTIMVGGNSRDVITADFQLTD